MTAPSKIAALRRLSGSVDLLREVAGVFAVEGPKLTGRLRNALDRGDTEAALVASHTLKSSVAVFGADEASALAQRIEDSCRGGDVTAAQATMAEFEDAVGDLIVATQQWAADAV